MFRTRRMRAALSGALIFLVAGGASVVVLAVITAIVALAYGGLTWLTDRWQPFAAFPVSVDATLFAIVTGLLLYGLINVRQHERERQEHIQRMKPPSIAEQLTLAVAEILPLRTAFLLLQRVALLAGMIITFSALCRHWYLAYGGFTASSTSYVSWLGYGVEWLLDNYTFNLTQIFGWHFSDVQASALGARALVLVFNVVLDVAAVGSIVTLSQSMVKELDAVQENYIRPNDPVGSWQIDEMRSE